MQFSSHAPLLLVFLYLLVVFFVCKGNKKQVVRHQKSEKVSWSNG